MNIEDIKLSSYNKLIASINDKSVGYGHISSKFITDSQLNYLRSKYIVVNTGKFGGSDSIFYMVCKV